MQRESYLPDRYGNSVSDYRTNRQIPERDLTNNRYDLLFLWPDRELDQIQLAQSIQHLFWKHREIYRSFFTPEQLSNNKLKVKDYRISITEPQNSTRKARESFRKVFLTQEEAQSVIKNFRELFDEQFHQRFPFPVYVSNLDMLNNSQDSRKIGFRIPKHRGFEHLPEKAAISIHGIYSLGNRNFRVRRVTLQSSKESSAIHEAKALVLIQSIGNIYEGNYERSSRSFNDLIDDLPTYARKTTERLKEWKSYLDFYETFIKALADGALFLHYEIDLDKLSCRFLVYVESEKRFNDLTRILRKESATAFQLDYSQDPFNFKLISRDRIDQLNEGGALTPLAKGTPSQSKLERDYTICSNLGNLVKKGTKELPENSEWHKLGKKLLDLHVTQLNNQEIQLWNKKYGQLARLAPPKLLSAPKHPKFAVIEVELSDELKNKINNLSDEHLEKLEEIIELISKVQLNDAKGKDKGKGKGEDKDQSKGNSKNKSSDKGNNQDGNNDNQENKQVLVDYFQATPIPSISKKVADIAQKLNFRKSGFISASILANMVLIERFRSQIRNLETNEYSYAPYLASYFFNVSEAYEMNEPTPIEEMTWYNPNLNPTQKTSVSKMLALESGIGLIQGPPGTGKTTVIAELIAQYTNQGKRILLSSQSHDAIDNALSRIGDDWNIIPLRLAKNSNKITEEGRAFYDENALSRVYHNIYRQASSINDGLADIDKQLKKIKKSQEDFSFISDEVISLNQKQKSLEKEYIKAERDLLEAEKKYDQDYEAYKQLLSDDIANNKIRKFFTRDNLSELIEEMEFDKFNVPVVADLDLLMQRSYEILEQAQVKIPEKYNQERYTDFREQNLLTRVWIIIANLLAIYQQAYSQLQELCSSAKSTSERTNPTPLTSNIEAQIKALLDLKKALVDSGNDDGAKTINDQIVILRKQEQVQVVSEFIGLSADLFHNAEEINDDFKARRENSTTHTSLAQTYLNLFNDFNSEKLELHQQIAQNPEYAFNNTEHPEPTEDAIKEAKNARDASKSGLDKTKAELQSLTEKVHRQADEYQLTYREDSNLAELCKQIVTSLEQKLEQLQQEKFTLVGDSSADSQNISKQFRDLLIKSFANTKKQATSDFNTDDIKEAFFNSCNLVAISCNEDPRTLDDRGFDGFDVAIIDEVSKAMPIELLGILNQAEVAILVGDHCQLPPMFNDMDNKTLEDLINEGAERLKDNEKKTLTKANLDKFESLVTASYFQDQYEQANPEQKERLTIQFRMHPQIMDLINQFYHNSLRCGNPELERKHPLELKDSFGDYILSADDHAFWVDTSEKMEAGEDDEDSSDDQVNQNSHEAKLIAKTLVLLNLQAKQQGYSEDHRLSVGVVSFYQPQLRKIREAIDNEVRKLVEAGRFAEVYEPADKKSKDEKKKGRRPWFKNLDVHVNTVIRYQGKEKDVILVSLVKNKPYNTNYIRKILKEKNSTNKNAKTNNANRIPFVGRFQFINVAMSRARNLLMVFGARKVLEDIPVELPKANEIGSSIEEPYKKIFRLLESAEDHSRIIGSKYFAEQLESHLDSDYANSSNTDTETDA